jgi:NADH-quinone oxidoreductase subunit N
MTEILDVPSLLPILPELILAVGAMALLMLGVGRGEGGTVTVGVLSIVLLIAAGAALLLGPAGKVAVFHGSFVLDGYARFLKILALTGSAVAILMSTEFLGSTGRQKFEYPILILLSTTGMMALISAADLIALYLGMELMSLSLYVIAAIDRDNVRSTEAGLKYFVLGALSSGMLLYGCSLIYGFTGTVSFAGIAKAAGQGGIGLTFGLVFLFVGFCFKISTVPFHMWTPDVYEGAPTPVTAFFAAAPKVAGIAVFVRASVVAFPGILTQWQQIVVFVSIASMALGSFAAIGQTNIKRLMAYSSITHVGYMLIGLAAANSDGASAVMFYLLAYAFTNLGAFIVITIMATYAPDDEIPGYAGLAQRSPVLAMALTVALLSLAGIPPFVGFFAKLYLFLAAIRADSVGLQLLVLWAVIMSAVSLYYYGRVIHAMWMRDAPEPVEVRPASFSQGLALGASLVGMLAFGILGAPFLNAATAASAIFGR